MKFTVTQQGYRMRSVGILSLLVLVLLPTFSYGAILNLARRNDSRKRDISKEELRESLNDFSEFFMGEIKQASSRLDELIPTTKTRKVTLMWRLRASQVLFATMSQEDAIAAFVDTWVLCYRLSHFFERGNGQEAFEPHQAIVIESNAAIVKEAERIARSFLDEEAFNRSKTYVEELAAKNPIHSAFSFRVVYASKQSEGGLNPLSELLALPLSPFRALEGVDSGAAAMHKFNDTANRITDVVELMPEAMRWQLLLLLFEMEETDLVRTVVSNLDQVSGNSTRLVDVAETLPEDLRKQASLLLDEIDEKQANLQETLLRAEQTAVGVESAMAQVDQAAATIGVSTLSLTETARAWEATIVAFGETAKVFDTNKPPSDIPARPFDILEYKETLEAATATAEELRALAVEIRGTVESQILGSRIDDVNETAAGIVRLTATEAKMLINTVTWRLVGVSFLVCLLAVVYRFLTRGMVARA